VRRIVLLVPAILLAAACSSGTPTVDGGVPHGKSSASPSVSPGITFLPDDVDLSLSAIGADTKKIAHDDGGDAEAADCRKLGTDASSAAIEKLPNPDWQTQWRKTMDEMQKAADECSSGQSTGDIATMQQALTDLTAADDDLGTFLKMTS
jgi:hypothetical protein